MSEIKRLQALCETAAPTGREKALRAYIQQQLPGFDFCTDGCGNLILHKPG